MSALEPQEGDDSVPYDIPSKDDALDAIGADWDIAIRHVHNSELRKRPAVQEFWEKFKEVKSLLNPETLKLLGSVRHSMRKDPVPLFQVDTDNFSANYQLHPNYSWLELGRAEHDADYYFYKLSTNDENQVYKHRLFMPIGRLFVNAPNRNPLEGKCNSRCFLLRDGLGTKFWLAMT
jgi:hypothetical protein